MTTNGLYKYRDQKMTAKCIPEVTEIETESQVLKSIETGTHLFLYDGSRIDVIERFRCSVTLGEAK